MPAAWAISAMRITPLSVGGDLVEVAPSFAPGTITAFNGASLLFEILCLLSEARILRTG
jgi:arginase family enzyme